MRCHAYLNRPSTSRYIRLRRGIGIAAAEAEKIEGGVLCEPKRGRRPSQKRHTHRLHLPIGIAALTYNFATFSFSTTKGERSTGAFGERTQQDAAAVLVQPNSTEVCLYLKGKS